MNRARKTYQVILEPPQVFEVDASEVEVGSRAWRLEELTQGTNASRKNLQDWLVSRGLEEEVEIADEPNPFNILFIDSTEQAAMELKQAPGVEAVGLDKG